MAERNIVVGPSAPPMMPMDAASLVEKSIPISGTRLIASAPQKATNMPTCAAPPRSSVLGFAIIGVKSVSAPSPRNIKGGSMFQKESVK